MKNQLVTKPKHSLIFNIFAILIILIYIDVRINHASKIVGPKLYPDSEIYLSVSENDFSIENNWLARVPLIVPLIYKMLSSDINIIAWFQTTLSIIIWIYLGFATSTFFDGPFLKLLCFLSVLIFSLSSDILLFDFSILSESISLSIMIAFISSWLFLSSSRFSSWKYTFAVLVFGILWIFTRDLNSLLMLALSVILIFVVLIFKTNINIKIISFAFLSFFLISSNSASLSNRWIPPNLKVVQQRILVNEQSLNLYIDNGMPINDTLMLEFAGSEKSGISSWLKSPDITEFLEWHEEYGKQTYIKYLFSNPLILFFDPIKNINFLVHSGNYINYHIRGFSSILPIEINNLIFFQDLTEEIIALSVICFGIGIALLSFKKNYSVITPLMMGVLLYPHALAVWTSSGGDVNRHSYQFRIQLRLTLILLLIFIGVNITKQLLIAFYKQLMSSNKIIYQLGIFIVLFSLAADFIFDTGDTFFLGYAQVGLIIFGGVVILLGFIIKKPPIKLWGLLIGTDSLEKLM